MARKNTKRKAEFKLPRYNRRSLLIILAFLVVVGVAGWMLRNHWNQQPSIPVTSDSTSTAKPYVNLSPPTAQEKQDAVDHKKALTDGSGSSTPTNADGKKAATVVVTSATPSTINGYASGVFEDGGTCTAKLTNSASGEVKTLTSQGFENASYTSCTPIHPNLTGSNWSVVLSYNSTTAEGSSASTEVK